MNVLITSASAKVALVKSFVGVTEEHNLKTFTSDIKAGVAAAFFGHGHFVLPRTIHEGIFTTELKRVCAENNIGLIIPTRDGEIRFMSQLKDEMMKLGVRILVPETDSVNICMNKRMFAKFVDDVGYKSVPELKINQVTFPAFVRPVFGAAGNGTYRVDSSVYLGEAVHRPDKYMIHPFIDADEFSIDLLMDIDGIRAIQAVVRQRVSVISGESKVSKVVNMPYLEKICMDIGEKLGLVGHNVIQAFGDSSFGKNIIIEANARFGGASNLGIVAGLDSPNKIIKMMLGDGSAYDKNEIKMGLEMYRYSEDRFING